MRALPNALLTLLIAATTSFPHGSPATWNRALQDGDGPAVDCGRAHLPSLPMRRHLRQRPARTVPATIREESSLVRSFNASVPAAMERLPSN